MCLKIHEGLKGPLMKAAKFGGPGKSVITAWKVLRYVPDLGPSLQSTVMDYKYKAGWNKPRAGKPLTTTRLAYDNKQVHGGALHLFATREGAEADGREYSATPRVVVPVGVERRDIIAVGEGMCQVTMAVRKCYLARDDYEQALVSGKRAHDNIRVYF